MAELIRLNFSTRSSHIETQQGLYRRLTSTPAASTKRQGGCRNRRQYPPSIPPLSPPFMLRVGSWIRLPGHLSSSFIQPPAFFQLHPEICASRIPPALRSTIFGKALPLPAQSSIVTIHVLASSQKTRCPGQLRPAHKDFERLVSDPG